MKSYQKRQAVKNLENVIDNRLQSFNIYLFGLIKELIELKEPSFTKSDSVGKYMAKGDDQKIRSLIEVHKSIVLSIFRGEIDEDAKELLPM